MNPEILCHGDLDALDLSAVPERLKERILEAEKDHVMNRPLAEVMVDAEDVLLVESPEQNPIKRLRRNKVVTEGFFNDDSSALSTVCLGQLFHDEPKQRRRDG